MRTYVFLSLFALTAALAADHPALGGTWVFDSSQSNAGGSKIKSETLSINQQPETVALDETVTTPNGKATKSEISCNTAGEVCKIKDHGEAEVSFWYNGGMLVMTETHGDDRIVKRRLKPSADGSTLTMEVIHLAPEQKTETFVFTRSQPAK
jgi:hypothetical protein